MKAGLAGLRCRSAGRPGSQRVAGDRVFEILFALALSNALRTRSVLGPLSVSRCARRPSVLNRPIDIGGSPGILAATLMKPDGNSRLVMRGANKALTLIAIAKLAVAKVAALPAKLHLRIWVRLEQCARE